MQESSPKPYLHYPFEHVQSPDRSLSTHNHHTRRDYGREPQDFGGLRVVDGLTDLLSAWGWLAPECEGPSQPEKGVPGQVDQENGTTPNSQVTSTDSHEPAQAQRSPTASAESGRASPASFTEEYGKFTKVLSYNPTSTVQLYEKKAPVTEPMSSTIKSPQNPILTRIRRASMPKPTIRELYAVKVFHNAKVNSNPVPKLPREGTRNRSLSHPNIVSVIDIIYNKQGNLCLVMPFCIGGNLRTFMQQEAKRKAILAADEVNCMGVQILRAIAFLHNLGIAHGDLSPEHILLTARGAVKVGGFGEDEDAVRDLARLSPYANSTSSRSRSSSDKAPASKFKPVLCIRRRVSELSTPYLPPERFSSRRESVRQGYWRQDLYDIKAGDIWACGMIYMVLRSGQLPWGGAQPVNPDKSYSEYLHCRRKEDGFGPIQVLENHCRNVVYAMLHPDPGLRITAEEVLGSEWALSVAVCEVGEQGL